MFLDEARIASQLDHPNVVKILEVDHDEDVQWFAMELVLGENLAKLGERARKKKKPIAPAIAARVIAEAAEGVHHAHTRTDPRGRPLGIIHRDVTPPNVMVTDAGEVKVLDFGIAKAFDRVARTEAGAFKGKVEYFSPEQILGGELDRRSDIFALGAVLFELLTGKKLFARASMVATLSAITECRVPRPSSLAPEVPAELDAIVLRALARDREERFDTAAQLAEALARAMRSSRVPPEALARWVEALCPEERAERRRLAGPAVRRAESLVEGPALREVLERAFDASADEGAPFVEFREGSEAPTQLARVRPEVSEAIDPIFHSEPREVSVDGRLEAELDGDREGPAHRARSLRSRPPPPPPLTAAAPPPALPTAPRGVLPARTDPSLASPARTAPPAPPSRSAPYTSMPPRSSPPSASSRTSRDATAAVPQTEPDAWGMLGSDLDLDPPASDATVDAPVGASRTDPTAATHRSLDLADTVAEPALETRLPPHQGPAGGGLASARSAPVLPPLEDERALSPTPGRSRLFLAVGFGALTIAGALVGGSLVYEERAAPLAREVPDETRTLDDVRVPAQSPGTEAEAALPAPVAPRLGPSTTTVASPVTAGLVPRAAPTRELVPATSPLTGASTPAASAAAIRLGDAPPTVAPRPSASARTATRALTPRARPRPRPAPPPDSDDDLDIEIE